MQAYSLNIPLALYFAWKLNIFTGDLYQAGSAGITDPATLVSNLLLQGGDDILLQNGDFLLMQA